VLSRRASLPFVAPLAVALAATSLVGLATRRASDAASDGAASIARAAGAMPRVGVAPAAASDDPVDYDAVTRGILGDLWGNLDAVQQLELRILVGEVARLGFRRAAAQPPEVRVVWVRGPASRGDRVVDVVTEGSSLTRNYREQIRRMMSDPSKGYPVVVERLKRKIARDG